MKLSINHITIFNIPSETCFAVEVHVWKFFLAMFFFVFLDQYIFRKKKKFRSLFILYVFITYYTEYGTV